MCDCSNGRRDLVWAPQCSGSARTVSLPPARCRAAPHTRTLTLSHLQLHMQGHQMPSLSTESSSGQVHAGHAAALMAAGLNGNLAAPLPLEAEERPAKRPRTSNRMVRRADHRLRLYFALRQRPANQAAPR